MTSAVPTPATKKGFAVSRDGPAEASWSSTKLGAAEFSRIAQFVEGHCGIRMPASKRAMVETRLRKRLRILKLDTFEEYCALVFDSNENTAEWIHLIDAITTNKTDFFREPQHFDYLVNIALPDLLKSSGAGVARPLAIWSAGCSSGEEAYTLSMVLEDVAEGLPGFSFKILGTDICTAVLETAKKAIYLREKVEPVPVEMRKKYLLRSRRRDAGLVRIAPEARRNVSFRRLNFMDPDFGLRERMDVIFCRNVLIYFERKMQELLIGRLCRNLMPRGYLFLGHSETISGLTVPVKQVAPTVYVSSV